MSSSRPTIGPEDYSNDYDGALPKRGYTTRGKLEQQRTAAPVFTGLVRRWERRWVKQGHLTVLKWDRAREATADGGSAAVDGAGGMESTRKRPRPPSPDKP